jgi:hypothetical protein
MKIAPKIAPASGMMMRRAKRSLARDETEIGVVLTMVSPPVIRGNVEVKIPNREWIFA